MSKENKKEKQQALELALAHIQKQFGEGAIMALGQHCATKEMDVIKTGAISLDIALGIGGIPRGRIIEIYGPESSGKSTLATHIVANAQKNGGIAAYIDAEHALDPSYAAKIGVDYAPVLWSKVGSFTGKMCFAGYGINVSDSAFTWNDFEKVAVKDKWVMVIKKLPEFMDSLKLLESKKKERSIVTAAMDQEALGVIFIREDEKELSVNEGVRNLSTSSLPVVNINSDNGYGSFP